MYDNAHFTKSKTIRNENAQLDCWKNLREMCIQIVEKIREMRNWVVAKNWQMRSSLLCYANLPGDFFLNCMPGDFMRNCFVAYGNLVLTVTRVQVRNLYYEGDYE